MKVKLEPKNKNREIKFPFIAECENGRIVVMFIGERSGICLKYESSFVGSFVGSRVGSLDHDWASVNSFRTSCSDDYYWQPYHGSITIEV